MLDARRSRTLRLFSFFFFNLNLNIEKYGETPSICHVLFAVYEVIHAINLYFIRSTSEAKLNCKYYVQTHSVFIDIANFSQHPTFHCHFTGTIQIRVRHARGVRGVRHLVVPGLGVVAASQAEEREKPDNQDK